MTLKPCYPYYLAGQPVQANQDLAVVDKYSGEVATRVAQADEATIDEAIAAAVQAETPMRKMPAYARQAVLEHCVRRFKERKEELAESLCIEAGKPIRDARGEVERLIDTFKLTAEESTRIQGEYLPLDISPRCVGYKGVTRRMPVGACSFISPFNFPLNLIAHKIAPAIAAGCPFVLKPASLTPVGALIIGEILHETDLPEGAFSILPCPRSEARLFVEDERLKLLSFTGSPAAGWDLKARAGKKRVILELGGNAACIVDEDADTHAVADRLAIGAFYQSGQSCISVQRIIAHEKVYESLKARLLLRTTQLTAGDPKKESTFIGPMITEAAAKRAESWIREAVDAGAWLLAGGKRSGNMLQATLLEDVPRDQKVYAEEVFAPVALMTPFSDFDEALEEVNDSRYGLQAGVFTRDIHKAHKAWEELKVGGVVIGDIPSWRVDHMPYGGIKDSGLGREGVRWSIEHLTEPRLMVVKTEV